VLQTERPIGAIVAQGAGTMARAGLYDSLAWAGAECAPAGSIL
jgi:hypothetical protein